jgi:hypothetical protein
VSALHPSSPGSPIAVWFVDGTPVRLVSGTTRFTVIGDPRCADINGVRYWRLRARAAGGAAGTFDIRESDEGWVLAGVAEGATRTGVS